MVKTIQDYVIFSNGMRVKNRAVLAPITLSACLPGGYVSQDDINFYARRSASVGMVITGSAYIHPQGQAFADSFSIAEDDKIEGLAQLAQTIKSRGALAVLQIYHGGRMVPPNLADGQPVAPSAVKGTHGYVTEPRALKNNEVNAVLEQFLNAVRRAIKAGFDGVELHGGNTYLIQQFCSAHSNIRQDKWGGTPNNRMRFAKTLLKRSKQLVKEEVNHPFMIGYRFSPEEIEEPGLELQDTLQLLEQLIRLGVDYLHASMSDVWRSSLRNKQQTEPIIHQIIKRINDRVPLIAAGNIHSSQDVRRILEAGIPLFSLGQALLLDPDWTQKIADGREAEIVRRYRDDLQGHLQLPAAFVESLRDYLETGSYSL